MSESWRTTELREATGASREAGPAWRPRIVPEQRLLLRTMLDGAVNTGGPSRLVQTASTVTPGDRGTSSRTYAYKPLEVNIREVTTNTLTFLYKTEDGDQYVSLEGESYYTGYSDRYATETAWGIPYSGGTAVAVETASGMLFAGSGFFQGVDNLEFRQHPDQLFPNRMVTVWEIPAATCVRSHVLKADLLVSDGLLIARHKRQAQSFNSLLLAAAQACGLYVPLEDRTVTRVVRNTQSTRVDLDNGDWFRLPASLVTCATGDVLPALSVACGVLRPASVADGPGWFSGRHWGGLRISDVVCGISDTLILADASVSISPEEDPETGALRARIHFGQDQASENAFHDLWWASERRQEVLDPAFQGGAARAGFSSVGDPPVTWNLLDWFLTPLGGRVMVVESKLSAVGLTAQRALRDFLVREKPLGSLALIASVPI